MSRIFDCFSYYNESFLLKLRCEELKGLNVTHILIESNHTFTGKPKPLYFDEVKDQFKEYNIVHRIVTDMPNNGNAWDNELHQRNYGAKVLQELGAEDDDLVIIADVDEIPRSSLINDPYSNIRILQMDLYYYFLNYKQSFQWLHVKLVRYSTIKKFTLDEIRMSHYYPLELHTLDIVYNGGWHFSYLGGVDSIINKMNNFSHQEYNIEFYNNRDTILKKIDEGEDLISENKLSLSNDFSNYPDYIKRNVDNLVRDGFIKEQFKTQ